MRDTWSARVVRLRLESDITIQFTLIFYSGSLGVQTDIQHHKLCRVLYVQDTFVESGILTTTLQILYCGKVSRNTTKKTIVRLASQFRAPVRTLFFVLRREYRIVSQHSHWKLENGTTFPTLPVEIFEAISRKGEVALF